VLESLDSSFLLFKKSQEASQLILLPILRVHGLKSHLSGFKLKVQELTFTSVETYLMLIMIAKVIHTSKFGK
jgi:hypothetical protein